MRGLASAALAGFPRRESLLCSTLSALIPRYTPQDAAEAAAAQERAAAGTPEPAARLELLCAGFAAPFDLSLAALRKYLWRRPEDLAIVYRLLNPAAPARRPTIAPPPAA